MIFIYFHFALQFEIIMLKDAKTKSLGGIECMQNADGLT